MQKLIMNTPALYGDHHVIEARRILISLPGVIDVYASSSFYIVEVAYDEKAVTPEAIKSALNAVGYLDDLHVLSEPGHPVTQEEGKHFVFRKTAIYEQNPKTVCFTQSVSQQGRPLWNCPGMGLIQTDMEPKELSVSE
jgi:hypothetical protein